MALILLIDTSSKNCSVCLSNEGKALASKIEKDTRSHAQILPVFIQEVLKEAGKEAKKLDAIAVSAGPGSYTGLRIGMSMAKGLCYSLAIPLIAMDSLKALALVMLESQKDEQGIYIATLDSRKGEIYYAVMNGEREFLHNSQPAIVAELDWDKWQGQPVYIAGNTQDKLKERSFNQYLTSVQTEYRAENYINLAYNRFIDSKFDDLVYKEPNYLKPFQ